MIINVSEDSAVGPRLPFRSRAALVPHLAPEPVPDSRSTTRTVWNLETLKRMLSRVLCKTGRLEAPLQGQPSQATCKAAEHVEVNGLDELAAAVAELTKEVREVKDAQELVAKRVEMTETQAERTHKLAPPSTTMTAAGTSAIPVARVNRIVKADKEVRLCSKEAVFLISKATVRPFNSRPQKRAVLNLANAYPTARPAPPRPNRPTTDRPQPALTMRRTMRPSRSL
ncbi:hypothetical protein JCM3770_004480 [Rhodotorula araucariae]